MTNAPPHDVRRPGAILSRLLVVLTIALLGLPQSAADSRQAQVDPIAQIQIEQAQGLLAVQRHLLRAPIPDDDEPEFEARRAADHSSRYVGALAISPALYPFFPSLPIRIQPPVRGPPAA
jgi:hypothetical protein